MQDLEPAGFLKLDAKINGTFASPVISGKVEAEELAVAGFFLEKAAGEVRWQEEILSIKNMKVLRGSQELQASGEIDFKNGPVAALELWLERAEMAELLRILGFSPAVAVTGEVTGTCRLLGPLESPAVTATVRLEKGRLGDLPVTGEADLEIEDSTVILNRLFLTESGWGGTIGGYRFLPAGPGIPDCTGDGRFSPGPLGRFWPVTMSFPVARWISGWRWR